MSETTVCQICGKTKRLNQGQIADDNGMERQPASVDSALRRGAQRGDAVRCVRFLGTPGVRVERNLTRRTIQGPQAGEPARRAGYPS